MRILGYTAHSATIPLAHFVFERRTSAGENLVLYPHNSQISLLGQIKVSDSDTACNSK
jgi:hypothetical protein